MKLKLAITGAVILSICTLTVAATLANFTAETTNPTNRFASGTLVLSDKVNTGTVCFSTGGGTTDVNVNNSCDPLAVGPLQPGQSSFGDLTLKNEGSLDASALKSYASTCVNSDAAGESYHGTGLPCSVLQFTVQQYSDSARTTPSTCIYGGGTATTCAFSAGKTLADYATNYSSSTPLTIGSGLAHGTSAYLRVSVQMPSSAGNTYQGRVGSIDLTWHLDQ